MMMTRVVATAVLLMALPASAGRVLMGKAAAGARAANSGAAAGISVPLVLLLLAIYIWVVHRKTLQECWESCRGVFDDNATTISQLLASVDLEKFETAVLNELRVTKGEAFTLEDFATLTYEQLERLGFEGRDLLRFEKIALPIRRAAEEAAEEGEEEGIADPVTMEQRGVAQVPGEGEEGTFTVTVPPGSMPGTMISVVVPAGMPGAGQTVPFMVPPGVQAGQAIAVPLPTSQQSVAPNRPPAPPVVAPPPVQQDRMIREAEINIEVGGGAIRSWLDKHKLGHIEAKLREFGVSELSDLYDLEESDLNSAGLKRNDKNKLSKALKDEKKAAAGVPDLKSWLDEHKLGHIEAKLREYGVSELSDLEDLDESDLNSAGLKKGDKNKLTKALEK